VLGQEFILPYFFDNFMTASNPSLKNGCWVVILGILSVVVIMVMIILASLLIDLSLPPPTTPPPDPTLLNLPTASASTATPGPLMPNEIKFIPEEPLSGFSNCEVYGIQGKVNIAAGHSLAGVQIIVWEEQTGLLTLGTPTAEGNYRIELKEAPSFRTLLVQVYQSDAPVSLPVSVQLQTDCQNGFQVYQINWHEVAQ
jgi:hypothetical protein